jgi:hypothetical protein
MVLVLHETLLAAAGLDRPAESPWRTSPQASMSRSTLFAGCN